MTEQRRRARDLGIVIGRFDPGPNNAITDVEGVLVGHCTLIHGHGRLVVGKGPVRTGVTAILPRSGNIFFERVPAGGFVLNGAGEVAGMTQVLEWGLVETPLLLTNTLAVGTCADAAVKYMVRLYPGIGGEHDVVIPVVGECDDSWLNDIAGRHVQDQHVFAAIEAATSGRIDEGNVGGGTGMITCDFSGGLGTSSRVLRKDEGGYTIGVLVQTNFGLLRDLRMNGIPVGTILAPEYERHESRKQNAGSIIAVVATNAPLLPHQLGRLSKRVALGIGRAGSHAAHGSGEIVVAFSTGNIVPRRPRGRIYRLAVLADRAMDPLYEAVVDATEEAILNAICMGRTIDGVNGRKAPGLPLDRVAELVQRYQFPTPPPTPPRPLRSGKAWAGPLEQVGPDGPEHPR